MLLFFTTACYHPSQLDYNLSVAGNNKSELEFVLDHYAKIQDSLKLRAAVFLIENMIYKYTLDSASLSVNQAYYDALESYRIKKGRYGDDGIYIVCDSIKKILSTQSKPTPDYFSDLTKISARFLINHIDFCFKTWKKYPWTQNIDFNIFYNYILPYRAGNSYWEGANHYFEKLYGRLAQDLPIKTKEKVGEYIQTNIRENYVADGTFFRNFYPFLLPLTLENAIKTQVGECYDINCICVTALRTIGIPAAINIVPYWGNSNDRHYWTETIGDTAKTLYDNTQVRFTNGMVETVNDMFWFKYEFSNSDTISSIIAIQNCRSVPKVFRDCYALQESSLYYNAKEEIPPFFRNPGLKDITSHYIKTADVEIELTGKQIKNQYVYLCCYNPETQNWTPVAWEEKKRNKAKFKNMGINILYLPTYYKNEKIIPAGHPFILLENGSIEPLTGDSQTRQNLILYSKVPFRTNTLYYAKTMLGCSFQTANNMDLSDTVTIYKINKIPFYEQDIDIQTAKPSRYAIYRFDRQAHRFIAELEFWGKDHNGKEVKLTGKPIGNKGIHQYNRDMAMDGDRVSYFFSVPQEETYIGLDFGKPCKISRIKFSPRSDDNGIVPGELYELFFWHNGWTSLGKQEGSKDHTLKYENIPVNALLRIHNHTRGKEHRPFTYENGKQIWW